MPRGAVAIAKPPQKFVELIAGLDVAKREV
jgi:hypothetical protein